MDDNYSMMEVMNSRDGQNLAWSVRQGGKVKVHTSYICLQDVKFVVQPAGREKVLKEKKKNVHAFVKGYLISHKTMNRLNKDIEWTMDVVTYNPYKHPYFTCGEFEAVRAELVDMDIDCVEDQVMGYSITIKAKKVEV